MATDKVKEKPKDTTIFVNAEEKSVPGKEIGFDELVKLAFPQGPFGGDWIYTITYRKAEGKPEGILEPGGAVKIKDGTVFNVTQTNKS